MQSCHRCVVSFLCAHAMRLSMRWYIRTNTRTYTYAHKNARGPFSRYGQHVLGLNQDNTNMYVCVYIYIYDCPVRLCLFEKTRASEHTHSHVGTDLKKFIDLTLHCLLPHCRSLCILADPFYFYFCAKSLTVICVLLLFLNTSGILFFLCTGNVFLLIYPCFVCPLASLDIFAWKRMCVLQCFHVPVPTHFVTVIDRLGTGVCVN